MVNAGDTNVELADVTGINVGDIMKIGVGDFVETASVTAVTSFDGASRVRRSAGTVTIRGGLQHSHAAGVQVTFTASLLQPQTSATRAKETGGEHMNKLALVGVLAFLVAFCVYVGNVFNATDIDEPSGPAPLRTAINRQHAQRVVAKSAV